MHVRKFQPALKLTRFLATIGFVSLFLSASTSAATDYFLKFDGITGGSTARFHEGWNQIDSFNWSITNTGSSIGGAASVGKSVFSDFGWTQGLDSSVTSLFSNIATGRHMASAIVDFTNAQGQTYFKMTFNDVLLTNVALNGSVGIAPAVAGSFDYGKITLDYWPTKPDGSLGTKSSAGYDLKTGKGNAAALAGVYAMGLSGSATPPVPEPETYAMLLAGLGIVGAMARRTRN
jgi:type VI protein secretion system component Hcp